MISGKKREEYSDSVIQQLIPQAKAKHNPSWVNYTKSYNPYYWFSLSYHLLGKLLLKISHMTYDMNKTGQPMWLPNYTLINSVYGFHIYRATRWWFKVEGEATSDKPSHILCGLPASHVNIPKNKSKQVKKRTSKNIWCQKKITTEDTP